MRWLINPLIALVGVHLFLATATAQDLLPEDHAAPLDEVVVTGVRAGPRLWKVIKGDHELWILGVVDPLPAKLQWHSQEVDRVLSVSQAVLLDDLNVSADANLFAKVGLYLKWQGMQKNPDGKVLKDVLPAELHARFAALQSRYASNSDFERLRPIIAAARLYQAALKKMEFSSRQAVSKAVTKQARTHDLEAQKVRLKVPEPRQLLESLNRIPLDAEVRCLAATLANLESDLNTVRERANAWALGDVDALRTLVSSENRAACWQVLTDVPRVEELTLHAEQQWFSAAEASLQQHRSSLALRGIRDLLKPDGVLEQFRGRGYEVVGP